MVHSLDLARQNSFFLKKPVCVVVKNCRFVVDSEAFSKGQSSCLGLEVLAEAKTVFSGCFCFDSDSDSAVSCQSVLASHSKWVRLCFHPETLSRLH